SLVAIHAEIAAADARKLCCAPDSRQQFLHVSESRSRRRVASVEHPMNRDALDATVSGETRQRNKVIVVGVDASFANQTHEMERAVFGAIAGFDEGRDPEEVATVDRGADAHEILHDDATRADIEVSHLGIADLSFGEPYGPSRRIDERSGQRFPESAPRRNVAERD